MNKINGNKFSSLVSYATFIGEINIERVEQFIDKLNNLKNEPTKKLEITFSSFGGYIVSAIALHDYLKSYPKEVEIIACGYCFSCGLVVLQAAEIRSAYKNTRFMFHLPNFDESESKPIANMQSATSYYQTLHHLFFDLTSVSSTLSSTDLENLCHVDLYFDADKALELGLINRII